MNWNDYFFVVRSSYRKAVVLALDVPRTPTQIAQKEGIDMYDSCLKLGLPPDARKYDAAVDILKDLNVTPPIRLLTNNPDKIRQLADYGLEAVRVPLQAPVTTYNFESLRYRKKRLGHLLELPNTQPP